MTRAPSDPPNPYGPPSHPVPPNHVHPQPGHPPATWGARPVPGGSAGTVVLTIQGNQFTSSLLVPSVRVNGRQIATRYGRQDIPVPAGPVHVEADAQWMRTYGQASLDFTVQPGQWVPVFYAAPFHQFTTGSMGHVQQQRKGLGAFLAMTGGTFLLIMVVLAAVIAVVVITTS